MATTRFATPATSRRTKGFNTTDIITLLRRFSHRLLRRFSTGRLPAWFRRHTGLPFPLLLAGFASRHRATYHHLPPPHLHLFRLERPRFAEHYHLYRHHRAPHSAPFLCLASHTILSTHLPHLHYGPSRRSRLPRYLETPWFCRTKPVRRAISCGMLVTDDGLLSTPIPTIQHSISLHSPTVRGLRCSPLPPPTRRTCRLQYPAISHVLRQDKPSPLLRAFHLFTFGFICGFRDMPPHLKDTLFLGVLN